MRYFTKELWSKISDDNNAVRMQAEQEWNANGLSYQRQFEEIKERLPQKFIKNYLLRNGLHDYIILCMTVINRAQRYRCELQLTNGLETILFTMYELEAMQINVDSFQHCIQRKIVWGYSEFEITPENNIQLSVLCDTQNEMMFQFKSMKITKISKKNGGWLSALRICK